MAAQDASTAEAQLDLARLDAVAAAAAVGGAGDSEDEDELLGRADSNER